MRLYLSNLISEYRQRNDLSLDRFSEVAGVSRSLIYQIERQQSVPTLQVLQKLATAMGMGLQEIVAPLDQHKSTLKGNIEEVTPHVSKDRSFVSYPLHSLLESFDIEIFTFRFSRTGEHRAVRSSGTRVIIYLEKGRLTILESGTEHNLRTGDIADFYPNRFYTYKQKSKSLAKGVALISRI